MKKFIGTNAECSFVSQYYTVLSCVVVLILEFCCRYSYVASLCEVLIPILHHLGTCWEMEILMGNFLSILHNWTHFVDGVLQVAWYLSWSEAGEGAATCSVPGVWTRRPRSGELHGTMPSSRTGCSSYKGKIDCCSLCNTLAMRWTQISSFIMMVHRFTYVLLTIQYWISYLCRCVQMLRIFWI
jgi:hypothetical protein